MATIPEPMLPAGALRAKHVVFAGIALQWQEHFPGRRLLVPARSGA